MPPQEVRQRMREADIFIFPSNQQEGWGAVVGEAMSEGCVVIANRAAGVSKVLIEHGKTGFLFEDGDLEKLVDILKSVLKNVDLRRQIGVAAAEQMQHLWHPRIGAERLIALSQGMLGLAALPDYREGPCSRCV
jgi:glycosyltransferase involved in cell wall biosynthesis